MGAVAGPVDTACQQSNRAASRLLCDCIQRVADMTLTPSDQKLVANIFRNPAKAQDIRQSGRASHREFWTRYTAFGEAAELVCAD